MEINSVLLPSMAVFLGVVQGDALSDRDLRVFVVQSSFWVERKEMAPTKEVGAVEATHESDSATLVLLSGLPSSCRQSSITESVGGILHKENTMIITYPLDT